MKRKPSSLPLEVQAQMTTEAMSPADEFDALRVGFCWLCKVEIGSEASWKAHARTPEHQERLTAQRRKDAR